MGGILRLRRHLARLGLGRDLASAPADQARVFDRFHRTVDGRADDAAAVGLGLPLARQFVEAHGGAIGLESQPGEGTTVTITLPRTRQQQAAYRKAAE